MSKCSNVEVTGAARLYRAASVWTAGLGLGARCLYIRIEVKRSPSFGKPLNGVAR